MFCSLISQPLLTSYNQWDLKVNFLERILRNLSLSSLKVIDMIFLPLSSYWENGYVWRYSSHIVTEGSFSWWRTHGGTGKKDGRDPSHGWNGRTSDLTNK